MRTLTVSTAIVAALLASPGSTRVQDAPEASPGAIGDATRDLVFTPVPRCRVIDTRVEGGRLSAGIPRHFDVADTLSGQGGAADCLVPFGASVVLVRVAPVQPQGAGTLTTWAFGGATVNGTAGRFNPGGRAARSVIPEVLLPICNPALASCTHDITIQADGNDTDVIADVTGYFTAATGVTVPWASVTGMPAGFADGVDDDTQYTAGPGLGLSGSRFFIPADGVTSDRIADGAIANVDISPSAAIAAGKVAGTAAVLSFAGTQAFDTNTLVIDAAANTVGFGTATPLSPLTVGTSTEPLAAVAQIGHGNNIRGLVLKRTANDAGYTNLTLLKSRGDTPTPALTGDGIGRIFFDVVDGDAAVRGGADVRVDLETLSPTELQTSMSFRVHEGAPTAGLTERLRITPAGISVTGALTASGDVSANRVTAATAVTAGSVTASGNVSASQVTAGTMSASGAVTAGSLEVTGDLRATTRVITPNVQATTLTASLVTAGVVNSTGGVKADGSVVAGTDVIAGGGVFVGLTPPYGSSSSSGSLLTITVDEGCFNTNRGELRVHTYGSRDFLCACLALETNDYQWFCLGP